MACLSCLSYVNLFVCIYLLPCLHFLYPCLYFYICLYSLSYLHFPPISFVFPYLRHCFHISISYIYVYISICLYLLSNLHFHISLFKTRNKSELFCLAYKEGLSTTDPPHQPQPEVSVGLHSAQGKYSEVANKLFE